MPPQVQDDVDEYLKRYTQKKVREEAQKQGVPVDYAERQAKAESAFRPDVITGRKQSSAGAIGAMQLMPGTAKDLGVNPYHIDQNIEGGVRYSKQMLDRYKGDQQKAAAAYNWGPGNVDRKGLANAPAETRAYQQKVAGTQGDDVDEFLSRWKEQPATKKEQLRPPFQSPIDMRLNAPNEAQKAYDRAAAAVQPAPQTPAPRPKQTLGQMRQQARTFQPVTQEDILRNPITPEERKASVESFIAKNEREKKLQQAAAKAKLEEEASRASQSTLGRMGTRFARGAVRGITQTPFEFVQMVNPDPVVQQTMKRIADDSKEWQSQNLPVDNRNPATLNVFKPEFYSLENVGKAATENIPEVLGEMLPQMALARGAGGVARLAAPELAAATVPRMASTTGAQLAARTAAGGYGAAQLSTQAYQKALDAGMTPEQAARAAAIEAPIGFSEFLGSPGTTGFTRPGTTIRREMREEGLQELGQTAASGLAGKYASGYDANKPLVDIAGESIGGGLLGAATGGIVATPGARLQAYRQGQQQRATRSAIDQRSAANAAAIASQPVQAQPVTEPLTEPLAAQPQPSAPATPQAQPQGFPRLPEPENFNARRAKLLGMPTPAEVGINEQIQAAAQLLDSQNEGDQRQAKRMLNKALSDLRKSEGYLAEAQLPPDAPRPFTAVRDAIEARLKPAPKVKETPASQVPSSPAVEAGQPTASNALRAEADAAKIKAAEFEQVGDFTQAAATYQAAHTNLKRLRRSMGMPKTPEAVAQINQIDREISIADANRRKALQQARTAQRQANAPTKDLAIPATFSRPKSAQVQAQQQDARNISSDISAPLLRPDAVQNPEGGIPQMPEPTFTDRLEAAARRDASARGKAKPAKRLLSRIAELGGISDRYAGELQDVKDARRIGVIRQKAEMSPDVLARQLQSEGYDVDPEDLNTLWEAARRDIAGRDERTSQTSELERRLAEDEAAYNERQPFDQIVADVDETLPPTERELPTQPEPQERLAVTKQNAPLAPPRAAQDYRGLLESPRTPQDVKARKRAIAALMPFNIQGNKSELLAKGLDQFVDVAAKSSKRVIDAFGGAGTYTHYLRSKGLGREGDVLNEYDPLRYITHKQIKENPQAVGEAARRTVEDLKRLTDTIQEGTSFTEEHANIRRQVTEYFRRRLMNLTQPGQRMTGKIRTGEPVEMQDSPELAGLYTVLQNQAFNFLPVQAEVGKKGFKLPGFAVVGNIGGKVRVFVKGRNLILNAPANIAEAGKRFQGLNVRRGDGWELIRKDAGDGDFVPVDTSYLNKEGQETTNYSKLTQEDAVPEVYVQKVQENLLPAWERGAKLLITNNWDENVASYLSSQGFRVFKDYRQGASKNERAAGGAAELIAINFDERTGQVFRRGGNALSGELARRTGQATEQRGSTLTRQGRPEELATGTQEQTTPLRGRGNASRPLAASGFQPDTADLREMREFAKREPRTEQFTEEPPTAPLARRRAEPQELPQVTAMRERETLPPIERREAKRQAVPKGMFGKLSESSYKGRPNALVENPQLRRLLGLGEMPVYRLPDAPINPKTGEPYVNPAWTAEAQNTLNALAELAGKERSSQVNFSEGAPHGVTGKPTRSEFGELFGAVTRLARRKGERIDPNLRLAFEETATRARGAQTGWQEFTVDERTENIRQSLYDTFRRGKLDRATDKALRDSFQSIAAEYGLSDTQSTNLYRQTRDEARRRAERAGSEPSRSAAAAPSVAERGERVSGNRGRGESATSGRVAEPVAAQSEVRQPAAEAGNSLEESRRLATEYHDRFSKAQTASEMQAVIESGRELTRQFAESQSQAKTPSEKRAWDRLIANVRDFDERYIETYNEVRAEERRQAGKERQEAEARASQEQIAKDFPDTVEPGVSHYIYARNKKGQKVQVGGPYESAAAAYADRNRVKDELPPRIARDFVGFSYGKRTDASAPPAKSIDAQIKDIRDLQKFDLIDDKEAKRKIAALEAKRKIAALEAQRPKIAERREAQPRTREDVENSPEFKRWFGDSVVTENGKPGGKPLVVYHGTDKDIEAFQDRVGRHGQFFGKGHYFAVQPSGAESFAYGEGANIVPSYLSIKNPLTVTTGTSEFRQAFALEDPAAITNTARGKGHDGIIIVSSRTGKPSEIIAFSPNQIKSAIGNRGTFDPNSAKITERREAPGFFSQLERVIDAKMPAKASAAQVRAIIENPQSGVKPEEVKWTGLDDYLRGKETVTKADVQEFLKANQVDVREVESGKKAYAQYTLPGAKEDSYRELLLTLPRKGSEVRRLGIDEWTIDGRPATREEALATSVERGYQSSHFDEPNILAHIRFNERTDADGKRVLHIEEIQSDWHQEGRKKGYAQKFTELPDGYEARETFPQSGRYRVYRRDGAPIGSEATTREGAIANALPVLSERSGVPDAPFKKTWHELAFKRALRWAAENGYERMTWTTGEQQAERFDLSKQVSRVQWNKTRENLTAYNLDGERVITESGVTSQKLEDYVGKEVAAKLANEPSRTFEDRGDTWHELSGLDLKVGGEGMKGFYDQILPAFANKYGRKWGVKVGTAQVEVEGKSANSEIPDVENALIEQRRGKKYRIKTDPELRQQMNLMAAKLRADSEALPAFQSLPDDQKAKIRQTYTDTPEYVYFSDRGEAKKFSDETGLPIESLTDLRLEKTNTAAVHSIDITPAMRESVMQGQPKFRREVSGAMPERYTGRQLFENARLTFRPARNRPATLVANDWGGAMLNQLLNDTFGITTTDANFTIAAKDAKDLRDYLADAKDSGTYEPAQVANMGAMLKQMDAAIADAEANQQDVAFVTRRPAEPISATKAKIRHETVHLSQSRIAADLSALTGKNWLDSQPNAADIHKELNRRGYAPETHDYEAAAFVASGDYGVFGMNLDQAAKFLSDYFGAVVQKHGKRALQKFGAIDPKLQPVLEAARRETGTTRSSTDGRTNETAPGTPRRIGAADEARGGRASVLARRREGDTGTAGEAGRSPRTRASIENSPEFKRWFSDSKVVDESGKPLVVYHGSPAKTPITEFAKEKANPRDTVSGFYFTEAPEVASEIYAVHGNQVNEKNPAKPENAGATYPVYISLKNPIDLNHYDEATREKLIAATDRVLGEGAGLGLQLYLDRYGNNDNAPHTLVHYLRLSAKPGGFLQKQKAHLGILATRILKAAGYDGATYIGENDAGSGNKNKHRAWIAFEPSQIKSAIGNRGTFDPSSPRITERKERPRFSFGRIPEGQGQVLASGFNVQGLFGRAPKEAKDGKPVPLPRNFNLADWSQKLYRDAMAAGLPKDARAKYDAAKTVREKNVILMESKLDSAREAKIFDLIDRAQAAAEKNDGSALYDVLSDATDLMRKTPSERGLKRVGQELGNAVSLPRAIMASMDVSAPLRQGAILTLPPSQWGKAAKATVRMFQSFSTAKYKEIGKQINLHEDAEIARESGLYLSTDKSGLLTKKEEDFISGWADKIPLVKHSEQAYKTYLDSLRMDSFARYKKSIDKTKGLSEEQKQKAYQAAAEWINTATGRGSLGSHFESAMPTLSKVLFAPRYVASRIQVLNPYTYAKNARTPEGRAVLKNQMSDMVQYAGMVSLTLALASAAGATVGLDPEDPDFLKIKVGQTRYDVLAGLQQPMRLFYRLGAAVSDRLKGEKPERNQSVGDISKKYVRSKLAPVPSFLWDYFEAKDFIGRDFEMKRAVLDRVTPLMWKDMADAYEKEGGAGAAKILPAAFGIGVQNYGERTGATKESRFTKEAEGRGLKYDFVRPKVGEPEAVYKQRVQRVEGWMSEYGDKLLSHPSYSLLTESQKQAAIENLRRRIGTQQNVREPKRDLFGNIESFAPEKVIQSVLKSEATRPKREAGKLWSPPANRP